MSISTKFISISVVAIIALLAIGQYRERYISTPDGRPRNAPSLDESGLPKDLDALLASNADLSISVTVQDLQTGRQYQWGEDASYASASVGKLVSAAAYLHKVETGKASLEEDVDGNTARTHLQRMIIESDNEAWHAINQRIGTEELAAYGTSIGLSSYKPIDNILTGADIASLLEQLARYTLLNNKHTDFLLSLMKEADMRNFIVAGTPNGSEAYHKVGYLRDRLHDVAIIKKGSRSFVLAILTKDSGAYDFLRGRDLFQEITKLTSNRFF